MYDASWAAHEHERSGQRTCGPRRLATCQQCRLALVRLLPATSAPAAPAAAPATWSFRIELARGFWNSTAFTQHIQCSCGVHFEHATAALHASNSRNWCPQQHLRHAVHAAGDAASTAGSTRGIARSPEAAATAAQRAALLMGVCQLLLPGEGTRAVAATAAAVGEAPLPSVGVGTSCGGGSQCGRRLGAGAPYG